MGPKVERVHELGEVAKVVHPNSRLSPEIQVQLLKMAAESGAVIKVTGTLGEIQEWEQGLGDDVARIGESSSLESKEK